jgi:hypothetical protein
MRNAEFWKTEALECGILNFGKQRRWNAEFGMRNAEFWKTEALECGMRNAEFWMTEALECGIGKARAKGIEQRA